MGLKKSWWDRLWGNVPLDYEEGYIEGFADGLKFYNDSIASMYKAVLDSETVRRDMRDRAKKLREV